MAKTVEEILIKLLLESQREGFSELVKASISFPVLDETQRQLDAYYYGLCLEVIGEDERERRWTSAPKPDNYLDPKAKARNKLRAEQRAALRKLFNQDAAE